MRKFPCENVFIIGDGGEDGSQGGVPGDSDVLEESGMIVVEDEGSEDRGVEVCVWVFLE